MPGADVGSRLRWWRGPLLSIAVVLAVVLFAIPALAAATISLEPSEGKPGDSFQITGQGFHAGDPIQLTWDGDKLGDPIFADAEGGFTATRTVPDDAQPGGHTVEAEGRPPNQLSASAIFTVLGDDSTTTTTTTVSSTTTTTTSSEATTTTESGGEDVEENSEEDEEVTVSEFTITPSEAEAGSVIRVEGTLAGDIDRVQLWLGDERLGSPIVISADGSFQATRTIPDLEPGVYSLELRNPGGRLLVSRPFRVLSESEAATTTTTTTTVAFSFGEDESRLRMAGPGIWAALVMLLVTLISVWWMYRRPKDEEKKPTGKGRDWRFWRRRSSRESGSVVEEDSFFAPEPTAEAGIDPGADGDADADADEAL